MGYRNRMLDSFADARKYADEAHAAMAKDKPDVDEAVRAAIDALGALHGAFAEWYDSCSPVKLPPEDEKVATVLRWYLDRARQDQTTETIVALERALAVFSGETRRSREP